MDLALKILNAVVFIFTLSCTSMHKSADLVIQNGNIYTVNAGQPLAEALAIVDGKIVHVGKNNEIQNWIGDRTQIIDLEGKTMTPGFIESHAHFLGMGLSRMNVDLLGVRSYEALIDSVAKVARNAAQGTWIEGRGWHQNKWDSISGGAVEGFPVHDLLSEAFPDHPVLLRHASGHAALANQKAMQLAGIDLHTSMDESGEIIRDSKGLATGMFIENAVGLIARLIPANDPARLQRAFELATETCLANGITSFHDAGEGAEAIALFKENLARGNMKIRMYVMLSNDELLLDKYFSDGPEIGLGGDFLTIRSIKLFADGALGSRGAWLLEPYADMPEEYGHSTTPLEEMRVVIRRAMENGFQVCTHAIGDRANREVLDIYEQIIRESKPPNDDHRFRIEHAQHLNAMDIPRFAELGVLPVMQAIHMSSDRPWAIERLGQERITEGAYVWQKLFQSGARVVNSTDAPVEPINPLANFYAAISRRTLQGYPEGGYEPDQKMSREQALRSCTINGAYSAFEEKIKGSIEVGKYADLTVFDNNIMTIPERELLDTRVVMTIINGNVAYENH